MKPAERDRLFRIRLNAKRGSYLSPEEQEFCARMFELDPDTYAEVGREVSEHVKDLFTF